MDNNIFNISRDELIAAACETYTKGDLGDAKLLALALNGRFVYDTNVEKNEGWYEWQGHYWKNIPATVMRNLVMEELSELYEDTAKKVAADLREYKQKHDKDDDPEVKRLSGMVEGLFKHAGGLRYVTRAGTVISVAAGLPGIAVDTSVFDRQQYIVAFANCVVDIRTGQKVEPQREHYITLVIPHEWHGLDAEAPTYDQFINDLFADKPYRVELVAFIDRMFGLGLAGDAPLEKLFPNFWGPDGDNGKSTLMNIYGVLMGPFGGPVSKDILMKSRNADAEKSSPALYTLMQQRVAWCVEANKSDVLDTGKVKMLTGRDPVSCRTHYQRKTTAFIPRQLLILVTNPRPKVDTSDDAFFNRAVYIHFGMQFKANPDPNNRLHRKADRDIPEKVLAEAPGVLARWVRGYIEYRKNGLNVPQELLEQTQEIRREDDILERFFAEECVRHDNAQVGGKQLWDAFSQYQHDGDFARKINKNEFGAEMKKRFRFVDNPRVFYFGIGLKSDEQPNDVTDVTWVQRVDQCIVDEDFDGADRVLENVKDRTIKAQKKAIIARLRAAKLTEPVQLALEYNAEGLLGRLKAMKEAA